MDLLILDPSESECTSSRLTGLSVEPSQKSTRVRHPKRTDDGAAGSERNKSIAQKGVQNRTSDLPSCKEVNTGSAISGGVINQVRGAEKALPGRRVGGMGNKWSLACLKRKLSEMGVDVPSLWNGIHDIIIKTLISIEGQVRAAARIVRFDIKNVVRYIDASCMGEAREVIDSRPIVSTLGFTIRRIGMDAMAHFY